MIIVYVLFLETLLKDLTNDMKFCVIMKQFWLTSALTKDESEVISANFFFFFFFLQRLPLTGAFEGFFSVCLNLSFRRRQSTVSMVFHAL